MGTQPVSIPVPTFSVYAAHYTPTGGTGMLSSAPTPRWAVSLPHTQHGAPARMEPTQGTWGQDLWGRCCERPLPCHWALAGSCSTQGCCRSTDVITSHCSSRHCCLRHEEERAPPPYLGEEVDFKACCFAGLGLPVVQVVSHCQHKLQTQTVVNDQPASSSTCTAPSPSPSVPLAPAVGSEPHHECSLR